MVIPKQFNDMKDLETMLMGNLLGILICLKEDIISLQQAENYWLPSSVVDTLEELQFTPETVDLFRRSEQLLEAARHSALNEQLLNELIEETKKMISANYTEYDEQSVVN